MLAEISCINISIGEQRIVRLDHWYLEKGKVYGLIGETGSGKSTLGKWLAGIEPVYWKVDADSEEGIQGLMNLSWKNGAPCSSASPLYLLQDTYQIFNPYVPILTHFKDIWRNQSDQPEIAHFDDIYDIMKEIGLANPRSLIKRKIHQISQGEAQRMAFVLGLLRPAPLRIYDEVFSNVDQDFSTAMLTWLRDYCRNSGTSVMVITHETAFLSPFADAIYEIREGRLDKVWVSSRHEIAASTPAEFKPLIELSDITISSYSRGKKRSSALAGMPEFRIGQGENVGMYGDSGVGKTTFLKGLLGEHNIAWKDRNGKKHDSRAGLPFLDIRYLPQSVLSAFNPVSTMGISIGEIQSVQNVENQEVERLLNLFGLDDSVLAKYPGELSGGEIQRMGIISVVLGQPDLVLLDESFSSVDQSTREIIWEVLTKEQQKQSFSLLVVSHDVGWLREKMNRVYEMEGV